MCLIEWLKFIFYFFSSHLTIVLSMLSKVCKQSESRISVGSENLSNETIFALVTSTPESSSNAMDKDIEIKNFINLQ